jgi:hypothetical protein
VSADFDADSGLLVASEAAVAALRAGAERAPAGWAELEAAGAVTGGVPHPALQPALEAMRSPVCALDLQRGDRRGAGWVDAQVAAMLLPEPDGRRKLVDVPTPFLPAALARMNELGPRPRAEPAIRLRFETSELLELLARGRDTRDRPEPDASTVARLLAGLREHWRAEARWPPARDSPGRRVVEVIDTDAGLWLVVPDEPTVELWPTTPTDVWTQLAGILPRDEELET